MMTNQDLDDRVYYDRKRIRITNKGIDARGDFYQFSQILKYEVKVISPDRKIPLILIIAGALFLIVGIGIFFIIWGSWMWSQQKPGTGFYLRQKRLKMMWSIKQIIKMKHGKLKRL
jgi:hypothetical protein